MAQPNRHLTAISRALRSIDQQVLAMDNVDPGDVDRRVLAVMDGRYMARCRNEDAFQDNSPLYPLPLSNGELPGEPFPATVAALNALTTRQLRSLLLRYGVHDIPAGHPERRQLFAMYIGARRLVNIE